MSRINTAVGVNTIVEWVQRNQEQVKTHPAWHPNISEGDSEEYLRGKNPFTYLLRFGGNEHTYFISFIKEDRSIKHQSFTLEFDKKGWYYRNGSVGGPQEVVSENIDQLIPMMMHCDHSSCIPLGSLQ